MNTTHVFIARSYTIGYHIARETFPTAPETRRWVVVTSDLGIQRLRGLSDLILHSVDGTVLRYPYATQLDHMVYQGRATWGEPISAQRTQPSVREAQCETERWEALLDRLRAS